MRWFFIGNLVSTGLVALGAAIGYLFGMHPVIGAASGYALAVLLLGMTPKAPQATERGFALVLAFFVPGAGFLLGNSRNAESRSLGAKLWCGVGFAPAILMIQVYMGAAVLWMLLSVFVILTLQAAIAFPEKRTAPELGDGKRWA